MIGQDIRAALIEVFSAIAPDGDYATLRDDRPLRDQLDIETPFDAELVVLVPHFFF